MQNPELLDLPLQAKTVTDSDVQAAYEHFLRRMNELKAQGWKPTIGWLNDLQEHIK